MYTRPEVAQNTLHPVDDLQNPLERRENLCPGLFRPKGRIGC